MTDQYSPDSLPTSEQISFDMARVYLHAGTPAPSKPSSIAFGFRISDAEYYTLDLSVPEAVGDAPRARRAVHKSTQPFHPS